MSLGIGKDSTSKTEKYASVLLVDIRRAKLSKSGMMKPDPFVEIEFDKDLSSPKKSSTVVCKNTREPEWNQTLTFLLAPGVDSFNMKIMDKNLAGSSTIYETILKMDQPFAHVIGDIDIGDTSGSINIGFQFLPFAEVTWMPQMIDILRSNAEIVEKQLASCEASLTQTTAALNDSAAMLKESDANAHSSIEAARLEAEKSKEDRARLALELDEKAGEVSYLQTQTASAKAKASMDSAKKNVSLFLEAGGDALKNGIKGIGSGFNAIGKKLKK